MCIYVNIVLFYNIGNVHHLQLRDSTQNISKQVVRSESKNRPLTAETVIQIIVNKLIDRTENDSSELPRYGLKTISGT